MAYDCSDKKRELVQNFSTLGVQQLINSGKTTEEVKVPEDIEMVILESDYLYKKVK
jgi:hypothetical protein